MISRQHIWLGAIGLMAWGSLAQAGSHTFSWLDPDDAASVLGGSRSDSAHVAVEPPAPVPVVVPQVSSVQLATLKAPACAKSIDNSAETASWFSNGGANTFRSRERIAQTLDQAKANGINTVYPVAWNRGYAFFLKGQTPNMVGLADETDDGVRDPLQEFIDEAKSRGMKVVPWFEYGIKLPCGHTVMRQHPDWMAKFSGGGYYDPSKADRVCYLNPAKPEVQDFLISMMADVVKNYPDIKGIQLDDNFPLPVSFGQGQSNATMKQTQLNFNKKIAQRLKAIRPDLEIHLSSNPPHWAATRFAQDWLKMDQSGYVDDQNVQVYYDDPTRFAQALDNIAMRAAQKCVRVTIGIYTSERNGKLVSCSQIKQQTSMARQRGFGVAYFPFRPDC